MFNLLFIGIRLFGKALGKLAMLPFTATSFDDVVNIIHRILDLKEKKKEINEEKQTIIVECNHKEIKQPKPRLAKLTQKEIDAEIEIKMLKGKLVFYLAIVFFVIGNSYMFYLLIRHNHGIGFLSKSSYDNIVVILGGEMMGIFFYLYHRELKTLKNERD